MSTKSLLETLVLSVFNLASSNQNIITNILWDACSSSDSWSKTLQGLLSLTLLFEQSQSPLDRHRMIEGQNPLSPWLFSPYLSFSGRLVFKFQILKAITFQIRGLAERGSQCRFSLSFFFSLSPPCVSARWLTKPAWTGTISRAKPKSSKNQFQEVLWSRAAWKIGTTLFLWVLNPLPVTLLLVLESCLLLLKKLKAPLIQESWPKIKLFLLQVIIEVRSPLLVNDLRTALSLLLLSLPP